MTVALRITRTAPVRQLIYGTEEQLVILTLGLAIQYLFQTFFLEKMNAIHHLHNATHLHSSAGLQNLD